MHSPANATNAKPVITLISALLFVLRTRRSEVRILPSRPSRSGSIPDTWVTFYSEDIGNTFGKKGLSAGAIRSLSPSK